MFLWSISLKSQKSKFLWIFRSISLKSQKFKFLWIFRSPEISEVNISLNFQKYFSEISEVQVSLNFLKLTFFWNFKHYIQILRNSVVWIFNIQKFEFGFREKVLLCKIRISSSVTISAKQRVCSDTNCLLSQIWTYFSHPSTDYQANSLTNSVRYIQYKGNYTAELDKESTTIQFSSLRSEEITIFWCILVSFWFKLQKNSIIEFLTLK